MHRKWCTTRSLRKRSPWWIAKPGDTIGTGIGVLALRVILIHAISRTLGVIVFDDTVRAKKLRQATQLLIGGVVIGEVVRASSRHPLETHVLQNRNRPPQVRKQKIDQSTMKT
ncbi:hypothetical protein C5Y93_14535 [Blastopirellula marina]|uniref:Uncharacterized protein n=1 Tax=Blastopirellula marina TaxID=124 RepID=A0A2S8GMK6_9BACT|nr:hypothetical protein C5Y93_14535 [Blastopirellula marina]